MANLTRRDRARSGELERSRGGLFDPFDVMRAMMGFDPFEDRAPAATWTVPFDVKETGDAWIFKADMPGVKDDDLDVSVTGNVLTVSGKREHESQTDEGTWHAYECSYGSFTRSFTLPDNADADRISAQLDRGELLLTVPKRPEMQPKKVSIGGKRDGGGKKDVDVKH